jgi:alpha-tubulin suppressor-like RCC1 family protein
VVDAGVIRGGIKLMWSTRVLLVGLAVVLAVAVAACAAPAAPGGGGGTGGPPVAQKYAQISAGGWETCGVLTDGRVKCWGGDDAGQLGLGHPSASVGSPTLIASTATYTKVEVGFRHACALTTTGRVDCWGDNGRGEVGVGGSALSVLTPTPIADTDTYVDIDTGSDRTCGVTSDGIVKCWGSNGSHGPLGTGDTADGVRSPEVVITSEHFTRVEVGSRICAITTTGELRCWGGISIGDGTTQERVSPTPVAVGEQIVDLTVGSAICAVTVSGTALCWGSPLYGAVQVLSPTPIASTSSYVAVADAINGPLFCGVTSTGSVECAGGNAVGQLGRGHTDLDPPGDIAPVAGNATYLADIAVGDTHGCAITSDQYLQCWGDNSHGQTGVGPYQSILSPTIVTVP